MKPSVVTAFILFIQTSVYGQVRGWYYFDTDLPWACDNTIYGIEGVFEDSGKTTTFLGNTFSQVSGLSFLKTQNHSALLSKHWDMGGTQAVPFAFARKDGCLFGVVGIFEDMEVSYALAKFDTNGNLQAMKQILGTSPNGFEAGGIKLFSLPDSPDLLLVFHGVSIDGTSEMHVYSLNQNLQPTSISHKLAFTGAKSQGFTSEIFRCDFLLSDSIVHYNLRFTKANEERIETGSLNIHSGILHACWNAVVDTTPEYYKPTKILKIQNDTVYHLINNALALYDASASEAIYYTFDSPWAFCRGLTETEEHDWVGIFTNEENVNTIAHFIPSAGAEVNVYCNGTDLETWTNDVGMPSTIQAKGNELLVWSVLGDCAMVLDEFNVDNIADCHPFISTFQIGMTEVPVHPSQVNVLASSLVLNPLELPTQVELTLTYQTGCNPNSLTTPENFEALMRIYPNPTLDVLNIAVEGASISKITLLNMEGSVVLQNRIASTQASLDLSMVSAGIYVLAIQTTQGTQIRKISKL